MVKVTIDHKQYDFPEGISIIEACHQIGIQIPHFCYHPKLDIAGNCRMCLVDLEGSKKPIPSCANKLQEGMVIHTTTERVKQDRQGVMEFLLINHPLDCPVCDQAGECHLQDQALHYGRDRSRYHEEKRSVKTKYMGPLISTIMTRCIHCTRCIRFAEDIAGIPELGALGRGEKMEITTYLEQAVQSEVSGNMIDLCPVGALNSKPYQFQGRPWELSHTDTIDVMDALGSHIRVDSRGGQVLRIKARDAEDINEIWLSDKSRFAYDGLLYQRLDRPYMRDSKGNLVPTDWEQAFEHLITELKKIPGHQIAALAGDLVDCETLLLTKKLLHHLESPHMDCRMDGAYADPINPSSFLFNTSLHDIEQSDVCVLIGTNPRWEAPLLNLRLRRSVVNNKMSVYRIGFAHDLTYPVVDLGNDVSLLNNILQGNEISQHLQTAKRPSLMIGQSALSSFQGDVILNTCAQIAEKYHFIHDDGWNGFNVLHTGANRVGALDVGFVPGKKGLNTKGILQGTANDDIKLLFLLGVDDIVPEISHKTFVVYIGHHGDEGAKRADLVLPGAAYTEKDGIYVNTEGRSQYAYQAVSPPGEAMEDWKIISEILTRLGHKVYASLDEVRQDLQHENREFSENSNFSKRSWNPKMGTKGFIQKQSLHPAINNFYMTNLICKYSPTMVKCTEEIGIGKERKQSNEQG